jgi:IclR family transcriptional regulator, KDG regulon repressor
MATSPRIQVLERAMSVLGLFTPERPALSLVEVAKALDLYPSTAHRLLNTLEDGGLLRREESSGLYRLGLRLLELSDHVMADFDVRNVAAPHLRALVHEFGEAVSLSCFDDGHVVYLDSLLGTHSFSLVNRIGARQPAYRVASGRAMLAHLPEETERLIESGLDPGSPATPMAQPTRLRGELAGIVKRGYAIDKGTAVEGFNAVAAAILDFSGTPVAAITVLAPSGRLPEKAMRTVGARVSEIAISISDELRTNTLPPAKAQPRKTAAKRRPASPLKGPGRVREPID